jgi:MinD-like ATPase involved in chromosome partitioning or flagellar assembly
VCVNQGNPIVLADSGSDFAKSISALAKTITQPEKNASGKKRRLSLSRS